MSIELNFLERGSGPPLVLVPGWSQTARGFRKQLDGLADDFRVIAIDQRGHGDSPKPADGYRIARLAQDLHEFLLNHSLDGVALAGHSMGCSVIWSYLEQFGPARLAQLIFIDQAPVVTNWFGLAGAALLDSGASFTPATLAATANALVTDHAGTLDDLRSAFFSDAIGDDEVAWNKTQSLKIRADHAAKLLIDHASQDWRDLITNVIPGFDLPVLVVTGALATIFPPHAGRWIAAQIPGAELIEFSAEERGSHFMFWENPERFNGVVRDFLRRHRIGSAQA
jgi:pimeloyl-ACP methyl ester carboxylesterase